MAREPRETGGCLHGAQRGACMVTPTPEAARGAFSTGWQREAEVIRGIGGTSLFLQDPSCQDLPTRYEMLGNITLRTDVAQLYMENRGSGYTHCIQKDKE